MTKPTGRVTCLWQVHVLHSDKLFKLQQILYFVTPDHRRRARLDRLKIKLTSQLHHLLLYSDSLLRLWYGKSVREWVNDWCSAAEEWISTQVTRAACLEASSVATGVTSTAVQRFTHTDRPTDWQTHCSDTAGLQDGFKPYCLEPKDYSTCWGERRNPRPFRRIPNWWWSRKPTIRCGGLVSFVILQDKRVFKFSSAWSTHGFFDYS